MDDTPTREPRDTAVPAAALRDFIRRQEAEIRQTREYNNPKLFSFAARYCQNLAHATYAVGDPVADCLRWQDEAVTYDVRFFKEVSNSTCRALGLVYETFVLRLPGAYLVGRADEILQFPRKCTFEQPLKPWERAVVWPLVGVFGDEPGRVAVDPQDAADLAGGEMKFLAGIPQLCRAVADHDQPGFASALDEFLAKSWGPSFDKLAKREAKSRAPDYSGRFSFLSAALCRIMGGVPALSAKAKKYLPLDLVNP